MSYWRQLFLSLPPDADTVDTVRHCEGPAPIVSDSVNSVAEQNEGTAEAAATPGDHNHKFTGVVAPAAWWEHKRGSDEPPFDQPCPERRGLIERRQGGFLHFCIECGCWGSFGFGVTAERAGRWYCAEHRPKEGGVK